MPLRKRLEQNYQLSKNQREFIVSSKSMNQKKSRNSPRVLASQTALKIAAFQKLLCNIFPV